MNVLITKRKDPKVLKCLSEKQYLFACEYSKLDFNGSKAALAAGYAKNSSAVMAAKLLKLSKIQRAIQYIVRKRLQEVELTAKETLKQLLYALTRKASDFFDEDGLVMMPIDLPDRVQSLVDGFKIRSYFNKETGDQEQEIEYKITPHATAREQALKHFDLFAAEKIEQLIKIDWDSELEERETDIIDKEIERLDN